MKTRKLLKDIFEYHHHFNQELGRQLLGLGQVAEGKVQKLFSHSINAHQIWNARLLNQATMGVFDLHPYEKAMKMDNENYENTQKILALKELDEVATYTNSRGEQFSNTIADILFHIANHFTHHRGQIIAAIRASGHEPLVTDYIFYKRKASK